MKEIHLYLIEGGPVFMNPILYLLILIFVLFIWGLFDKKVTRRKIIDLISSLAWFTLIWGILGQAIQLYDGFNSIQMNNGISMGLMAGVLKISVLSTAFGSIVFLIARLEIIILILIKKED